MNATASAAALSRAHIERITLAVKAMDAGKEVIFSAEWSDHPTRQYCWYQGTTRNVILTGEGKRFDELARLVREEFVRQLTAVLQEKFGKLGVKPTPDAIREYTQIPERALPTGGRR